MIEEIAAIPFADIPLVVLDTETTGLFPGIGDRVVEIGAVRFENWQAVAEINQLIQPDRQMGAEAGAVNGITDEDLRGQPRFYEIAADLLKIMEGALLVAHNAAFDASFIGMEFYISGLKQAGQNQLRPLPNPWLCTMQLARRRFHFRRNNLATVASHLGIGTNQSHRAISDVYMTAEVLKRMEKRLGGGRKQTVGDLLYAQGGPIYTPQPPRVDLPRPIQQALENNLDLDIEYAGPQGTFSRRIITLRYTTEFRGAVYLIAYCHRQKDQRTFRLDRIRQVKVVNEV